MGAKRREIPFERKEDILRLLAGFEDGATRRVVKDGEKREVVVSRVYPTTHFGFRKITVERPLRLDFQASLERIARLDDERAFANLAVSRKRGEAKLRTRRPDGSSRLRSGQSSRVCRVHLFLDRTAFDAELSRATEAANLKLTAPVRKSILSALSERNQEAAICRNRTDSLNPILSSATRKTSRSSRMSTPFFKREVRPHVRDAWIDTSRRDPHDGEVGLVGYEINFNRYFYEYRPPRPLEEIEADIQEVEKEIVNMLREVTA